MCFSATASFTAAAGLGAIGLATTRAAPTARDLPFAALPMLFAFQQFAEGLVWLRLDRLPTGASTSGPAVHTFALYSHVFWPVFVPLAVLTLERVRWRRLLLAAFVVVGVVVAANLGAHIASHGVSAHVAGRSIHYHFPKLHGEWLVPWYLAATCASCLVSSHRAVKVFGVAAFGLALVAQHVQQYDFVSVWCFYAAVLSSLVIAQVVRVPRVSRPVHGA